MLSFVSKIELSLTKKKHLKKGASSNKSDQYFIRTRSKAHNYLLYGQYH